MRLLRHDEVSFERGLEEEVIPVEGNAMCSGDKTTDDEANAWVFDQLRRGNEAAWCCAVVKVQWKGFRGIATLGACSYRSETELWEDLAADMESEALADLNSCLARHARTLASLDDEPCGECGKVAHENFCSQPGSDE